MTIRPLGRQVLLLVDTYIEDAGIVQFDTRQQRYEPRGVVQACGEEVDNVYEADTVIYQILTGQPVMVDDKPHLLLDCKHILAVVEE